MRRLTAGKASNEQAGPPEHRPDCPPLEKALSDGGWRYGRILDNLPAALCTCDLQGRIQYYNHAAAALWGRRPELGEMWCGSYRIYTPDGAPVPVETCPMAIALREGRSIHGQEIVIERPDGTRRHVLPHPEPLTDDAGNIVGAVNMLVDITEHKRAGEIQSRLAAIVESSDDAIISKTLDGVITSWNSAAERLFGYSAAEAIGKPITLVIPADRRDEERTIIERLRQGERIDHYETIRISRHGKEIDISLTISPIRDDRGRIIGASTIAREITERKRVEQALKDADRRKDEFLAMLAHELRNPLAPLRSSLQVLRMTRSNDKVIDQTRGIMQRQVDHMVRLIDDLLDISRISRGKLELLKQRIPLAAVIDIALETCDPLIKKNHHELIVTMPPHPLFIEADQVRVTQVLDNLLTNASKFTPAGGTIWLKAERDNDQAVISVKDTGCGIAPEMLTSIFEMFAQAQQSLERSQGGLGIGLTLVKRLVEMHGGSVEARSAGLGKGSEFVIRLPLAGSVIEQHRLSDAKPPPPPAGKRVLVADDNHDAAECLGLMLEMMGNEVRTAHDGQEAVELAETFRPQIILLDLGMPGLSGYDAARLIRQQSWSKNVRLVALTGWGQEEDKQRTRAAGFDHHLVKPAEPELLEKLLAE
jgi:PAS domain S-box-containing protein